VAGGGDEVAVVGDAVFVEPLLAVRPVEDGAGDALVVEHLSHPVGVTELLGDEHHEQAVEVEAVVAGVPEVRVHALPLAYRGDDDADVSAHRLQPSI